MATPRWQLDASYRGVPFFVEGTDDEYARRGAHHQYPLRDKGVWEDLGADDPVYNFNAYVTELSPEGYKAARDKIVAACTAGGLADLVHPYFGTKKVQCTSCRVTHNDKENGVARFALSFIEADEPAAPAQVDDSAAKVHSAADAAQEAVVDAFAEDWNLAGVPGYVYDAATSLVQGVADTLTEFAGPLPGMLEGTTKFISGTARLLGVAREALEDPMVFFTRQANGLTGNSLLGDGAALGKQVAGLGRMLTLFSGTEKQGYATQQGVIATGQILPAVPLTTANRKTQAKNQEALHSLVERTAVIEAARMTPYMPFESRDDAVVVRDTLTAQLDALAEKAPDTLYKRLETLRAAVVADITKRGPELGRIGSYTTQGTRPALVVAYDIYQNTGLDAGRATELAVRNNIHHPGFVTGGTLLEVKLNA